MEIKRNQIHLKKKSDNFEETINKLKAYNTKFASSQSNAKQLKNVINYQSLIA